MKFAKLHGAGNDFLLFDGAQHPTLATSLPALVARLCDRRLGIGADGVLLLLPAGSHELDVHYWNADGSLAAFCANGTRCAARFAATRWGWDAMTLRTPYAAIPAKVDGQLVELTLPAPERVAEWTALPVENDRVRSRYLIVGVPHLIVPVEWPDFWRRPLAPLAPALRAHPALPTGGANVSFIVATNGTELAVRSWERGIEGETLSCGSGDVAAALVALAEGWVAAPARARTASGRVLTITPLGEAPTCAVRLSGPAEWVADGEINPELLASA